MARTIRPGPTRRTWIAAAALVLVVAAAGALAWTAIEADRAQRAAAEATVRDYADFAAFILATEAEARLRQALFYTFYREDVAWRRGERVLDPREIAQDPQESARCEPEYGDGERWSARLDLPGGDLRVEGSLAPAARAWVADTLRALAAHAQAGAETGGAGSAGADAAADAESGGDATRDGHIIARAAGARRVVAYRVRSADGEPVAAYALASCLRDRQGEVVERALAAAPLLPPTLVGGAPADSLVSVRLIGPDGTVLYRGRPAYASAFVGSVSLPAPGLFGGSSLEVTLRPGVADRLAGAGTPFYSRAPLVLGLLVATVSLVAIAALLLVRSLALVRARERFVADVSHELRTPLQQVLMFAQLLRIGQARSAEERDRFLSIIEREALRLIALVERVLDFARPRRSSPRHDGAESADVVGIARETIATYRPLLRRGQDIALEAPEVARVDASADGVRQICLNLLDNAAKYGPAGQRIRVRVRPGAQVALEVQDAGPGVPPGERTRIWEAFYRLEREGTEAHAGSGIGLAVVREIAERYGADTEVEDAPEGGALFRVRFRAQEP